MVTISNFQSNFSLFLLLEISVASLALEFVVISSWSPHNFVTCCLCNASLGFSEYVCWPISSTLTTRDSLCYRSGIALKHTNNSQNSLGDIKIKLWYTEILICKGKFRIPIYSVKVGAFLLNPPVCHVLERRNFQNACSCRYISSHVVSTRVRCLMYLASAIVVNLPVSCLMPKIKM